MIIDFRKTITSENLLLDSLYKIYSMCDIVDENFDDVCDVIENNINIHSTSFFQKYNFYSQEKDFVVDMFSEYLSYKTKLENWILCEKNIEIDSEIAHKITSFCLNTTKPYIILFHPFADIFSFYVQNREINIIYDYSIRKASKNDYDILVNDYGWIKKTYNCPIDFSIIDTNFNIIVDFNEVQFPLFGDYSFTYIIYFKEEKDVMFFEQNACG